MDDQQHIDLGNGGRVVVHEADDVTKYELVVIDEDDNQLSVLLTNAETRWLSQATSVCEERDA